VEDGRELGFVLVRVGAYKLDHLSVTVSGLFVLAARFVNHSQPIVAVVYFGKAHEEPACCGLSLIELAGAHESDDRVGCLGEIVLFLQRIKGGLLLLLHGRGGVSRNGRGARKARVLGRFLFRQTTAFIFVSAAAGAGIVASRFSHGAVCGSPVSHFTKKGARTCTVAPLGPEHCVRLSFCCAVEGCGHRATPPSLRFLGPKVYWAAVVVLISAMRCGPTPTRMQLLKDLVGVSRQTVMRWTVWWQQVLPESPFWRTACGGFRSSVQRGELPQSLLEQFAGHEEERLLALLRFLAPLSGGRGSALAI